MKVLQAEKKQSKAESDSNAKTMLIGMGVSVAFLVGLISFLSFFTER